MEFFFPHDKFIQGKILPRSKLLSIPRQLEKLPENVCTLPNNHYWA